MMSTVFFGSQREERIRRFVALFPFVSTSVVQYRFFTGFKTKEVGLRKTRQVLQRMVEKKMLKRFKLNEYLYHIEPKTEQWFHTYCLTKFHFDFAFSLSDITDIIYDIIYYKREFDYGFGRADGLYCIKINDGGIKFFLEYDDGRNKFDKIAKYEEYFKSGLWKQEYFADPLKNGRISFPVVLVVTEREIPNSDIVTVKACRPGSNYREVLLGGK